MKARKQNDKVESKPRKLSDKLEEHWIVLSSIETALETAPENSTEKLALEEAKAFVEKQLKFKSRLLDIKCCNCSYRTNASFWRSQGWSRITVDDANTDESSFVRYTCPKCRRDGVTYNWESITETDWDEVHLIMREEQ